MGAMSTMSGRLGSHVIVRNGWHEALSFCPTNDINILTNTKVSDTQTIPNWQSVQRINLELLYGPFRTDMIFKILTNIPSLDSVQILLSRSNDQSIISIFSQSLMSNDLTSVQLYDCQRLLGTPLVIYRGHSNLLGNHSTPYRCLRNIESRINRELLIDDPLSIELRKHFLNLVPILIIKILNTQFGKQFPFFF
jgi:hypothetical protein